jgi:hypothetical protein
VGLLLSVILYIVLLVYFIMRAALCVCGIYCGFGAFISTRLAVLLNNDFCSLHGAKTILE